MESAAKQLVGDTNVDEQRHEAAGDSNVAEQRHDAKRTRLEQVQQQEAIGLNVLEHEGDHGRPREKARETTEDHGRPRGDHGRQRMTTEDHGRQRGDHGRP